MAEESKSPSKGATGILGNEVRKLMVAVGDRALAGVAHKMDSVTDRLAEYAEHPGDTGLVSALTGKSSKDGPGVLAGTAALAGKAGAAVARPAKRIKDALTSHGNGNGNGGEPTKVTNIVEEIDIGAPVRVCYDQWTRFTDFPTFMKKVENVEQESDEKLNWKAQVFWSHRTWQSTIIEQVPDQRIVWQSTGDKGYVDGAVTFHELAPEMTRVILVLEYHPQGLFEHTGNLWRAQGRRARLELKHFARHVMTQAVLHPEEVEGWRGEIHDSHVESESEESPEDGESPSPDQDQDQDQDQAKD